MLDTIGTLIAFVTVVLLLSLVSTSLVQMTSSVLRLRGRNLFRGIEKLLEAGRASVNANEPQEQQKSPKDIRDASEKAVRSVFSSSELLNIERRVLEGVPVPWRGPVRTWIDRAELKEVLTALKEVPQSVVSRVDELFPRLEKLMSARFAFIMRVVSIIWAVVVAVLFQVSAPDLLRDLSTNPELRKLYAESLDIGGYSGVVGKALDSIRTNHPELADSLQDVTAGGLARNDLLAELRTALGTHPERDAVVDEYERILDTLSLEEFESSMDKLAQIDIQPWGQGNDFYVSGDAWLGVRWGNVGGVLIMAVLLSLGAPFWYQALKNLSGLRDMLAPKEKAGA